MHRNYKKNKVPSSIHKISNRSAFYCEVLPMTIKSLLTLLQEHTKSFQKPLIDQIVIEFGHSPYLILIACLLSLRAKDSTTIHVCRDLFSRITTPQQMLMLPRNELEIIIFKTGFYKNKAQVLHEVSRYLLDHHGGQVPATYEALRAIPGVGPKTANLVLGMAFGVPSICVDTHVHRISNRLGLIKTTTVEDTEAALKKILPQDDWIKYNNVLVMWGQNVCVPISPKCSTCVVRPYCKRVGVTKSR